MALKIWIDGELKDKAEAKISVYDHGLLYGDGVFEGIRLYNGKVFESEAHLKRLYDSAKAIRLTIPVSRDQLHAAIADGASVEHLLLLGFWVVIGVRESTECHMSLRALRIVRIHASQTLRDRASVERSANT